MSMTPSVDEERARALLADTAKWRDRPEVREAAEVRSRLDQTRALRAANIIAYLTADRTRWPVGLDLMLRDELGIDELVMAPGPDGTDVAAAVVSWTEEPYDPAIPPVYAGEEPQL